mgnify:CR=1 FL=1
MAGYYIDRAQPERIAADRLWVRRNAYRIGEAVGRSVDADTLRQIAALVGYVVLP